MTKAKNTPIKEDSNMGDWAWIPIRDLILLPGAVFNGGIVVLLFKIDGRPIF